MLFPLFSRDYCGNQLLICGVTQPVLNNLSLANDSIRFHSSVTAHGMLWRLLVVFVISGVTLGLAYPWLKIWLVSWLAQNTQVEGDLDSLELTNDEKPLENSPLMWISRGIMPYFPFI